MFYYKIFGLTISSNINILFASSCIRTDEVDVYVDVSIHEDNYFFDKVEMVQESTDEYTLYIPQIGVYAVQVDRIKCKVRDYRSFISTFFNLPCSVLLLLRSEFLFHACALKGPKGVYLISGEKGAGKSTLSSILMNDDMFSFYADDTIRIDHAGNCFGPHKYIKLNVDILNLLNLNSNGYENIAGKKFIYAGNCKKNENQLYENSHIYCVLHISRGNTFSIKNIDKTTIYTKRNIVGVEFMHASLIQRILSLNYVFANVFQLTVPDNLDKMISEEII
jgi:hypothetical protein